jgi:hypothetical protein
MAKRSALFSNEISSVKGLSLTFLSYRASELFNEVKKGRVPDEAYDKFMYAKVYRLDDELLFIIIESRNSKCRARRGMSIKCSSSDAAMMELGYWIDFLWNYKSYTKEANIQNRREMSKVVEAMLISRGFQLAVKTEKSEADQNGLIYRESIYSKA